MSPLCRGVNTVAESALNEDHDCVPTKSVATFHPSLLAVGAAIRALRIEHELSQEMLALISGVDRSYLGKIERGENNAALLTLLKICDALGLHLEDLARKAQL